MTKDDTGKIAGAEATPGEALAALNRELAKSGDELRAATTSKRHARGFRTARENLEALCDPDSFVEYGQLAVAAQRSRRTIDELRADTPGDGIITGTATINSGAFGQKVARIAIAINDYGVLAGTQGFFHHKKIDRILKLARKHSLPVVMFTEGGGGRPGDTDITTQIAGLDVPSFALWASMAGQTPRIAVNNGYCFAGNAALFGAADIRIATRSSNIGMAGPAMIEGGGMGTFSPRDIGPADEQFAQGVIDILADDEAHATMLARQTLSYFQGATQDYEIHDQARLRDALPENRRFSYKIRELIQVLVDKDSLLELNAAWGSAIITAFARIEGRPIGLFANDPRVLGGAIDSDAAKKCARFLRLCNAHELAVISLCDTPGFMVGPDSESEGAVSAMADLFVAGATLNVPLVAICLRKAYGLGAMAMAGGSFANPTLIAAWPSGEFGAMGLEGAVRLGYRKEIEAAADPEATFEMLLAELYEKGRAVEAATCLEIDAVIDPVDTRSLIVRTLSASGSA